MTIDVDYKRHNRPTWDRDPSISHEDQNNLDQQINNARKNSVPTQQRLDQQHEIYQPSTNDCEKTAKTDQPATAKARLNVEHTYDSLSPSDSQAKRLELAKLTAADLTPEALGPFKRIEPFVTMGIDKDDLADFVILMREALSVHYRHADVSRDILIQEHQKRQALADERVKHAAQIAIDVKQSVMLKQFNRIVSGLGLVCSAAMLETGLPAALFLLSLGNFCDNLFDDPMKKAVAEWWVTPEDPHGRKPVVDQEAKADAVQKLDLGFSVLLLAGSAGLAYSSKAAGFVSAMKSDWQVKLVQALRVTVSILGLTGIVTQLGFDVSSRSHQVSFDQAAHKQDLNEERRHEYLDTLRKDLESVHRIFVEISEALALESQAARAMIR